MNLRFWTWGRKTPQPAAPAEVAKPIRKGWGNLAAIAARMGASEPAEDLNPYRLPDAAPGVIPKTIKLAVDSAMSTGPGGGLYGYAGEQAAYEEGLSFPGYAILSEMAQRTEYRRPAEILAKEITRKWLRVTYSGDGDASDKILKIEAELKRLNAQKCFREAEELDGFFGRAQIFLDTGATDGPELTMPMPLTPAKIGKGALKALRVVEPIWTYPSTYNASNALKANFFKPQTWYVQGQEIHASRLLTFVAREVPDMLKPAYAFGGLSLTQLLKPYVDNWLKTRQAVSDLVSMFSVSILKTDLAQLTAPDLGQADLVARMQLFNQTRNNRGAFVLGADEEYANVVTPLGTLDALQAQAQEHQSSAVGIPLVKYFGITPKGLNGSTDGEIQCFEEWIESLQEGRSPLVKHLLDVVQLSLFGEIDDQIGHKWMPLKHESATELAASRKTEADTDAVLVEAGILAPLESRQRLAADEDGPYAGLNVGDVPAPPEDESQSSLESGLGSSGEKPVHEDNKAQP